MKFLVFEGLDGAGKSTLIKKVEQFLNISNRDSIVVRDPGSTTLSEKLRALILDPQLNPTPRAELLMYQASRTQLVTEVIAPKLKNKTWVLSDRFYSSTIAFQCVARGLDRSHVDWLNNYACAGTVPDLVIFIDIEVAESQNRLAQRTVELGTHKDRMEQEDLAFHQRVRDGYLMQAQENPDQWLVLNGLRTPEQLYNDVLADLRRRQWL